VEANTGTTFVAGYEEALGYTVGTIVRDKDGVSALAVFAEMAAYLRSQGKSVLDELEGMARTYGLFVCKQVSRWHQGIHGAEQIKTIMSSLRHSPPSKVLDLNVVGVCDYERRIRTDHTGATSSLNLPRSNVLSFELAGGSRIVARPSGTEPKIKFYFDHCEAMTDSESMMEAEQRADQRLQSLVEAFLKIVDS